MDNLLSCFARQSSSKVLLTLCYACSRTVSIVVALGKPLLYCIVRIRAACTFWAHRAVLSASDYVHVPPAAFGTSYLTLPSYLLGESSTVEGSSEDTNKVRSTLLCSTVLVVQYILCTIEAAVLYCATALLPPNTTEDLRLRQLPLDSEQSSITIQQRLHHLCSTSQIFALPIIHPLYTRLLWLPALHYWLQAAGRPDCHNSCASLPESTVPALRFIHCHTQRSTADTSVRLRGTGTCLRSHRSHVGAKGLICDSPAPDQFHTGSARLHRPRTRPSQVLTGTSRLSRCATDSCSANRHMS